ncbi:MAG: hypothetical protein ACJ8NS_02020 [Chthoniobacterales bacterium]
MGRQASPLTLDAQTVTMQADLLETVEKLSHIIPSELLVRVDPDGRSASSTKMGLSEINAILVTLGVAATAAKPVFDFVVNLARAKKCRLKLRRRWITPKGIEEQEVVLEGSGNNSHVTALIEDAIKKVRQEPAEGETAKTLPSPTTDIDLTLYPIRQPDGNGQ